MPFATKEKYNEYMKKYQRQNSKQNRNNARLYHHKLRLSLIKLLGSKCNCKIKNCCHKGICGIKDLRCLQIDHINGNGAIERKRFKHKAVFHRFYLNNPDKIKGELQLLCSNCNWVKRFNNNEGIGRPTWKES